MLIGIDTSRAYENNRTGIEEYSYQVIGHLVETRQCLVSTVDVVLYLKKNQKIDFKLPDNWKIKIINFPYLWTQIGLSLELLFHPVDTLFIPAHVVPCVHPKNTIVTIHGLEYEFCPNAYSWWAKLYMRWSIKKSCQWAKKIIAVSENTKKDLMKLYKVPEGKIEVIYEGVSTCHSGLDPESSKKKQDYLLDSRFRGNDKYLLFIGRLEERKNIIGIVKAFEILKEKYKIPQKLVLAGKPGFGYEKIKREMDRSKNIILAGYISEEEKWGFLKNADVFLFPTFYEGFGLPILEAQSVGVPVVASNNSSIPEIFGVETHCNASLQMVDPNNSSEIAEAAYNLISDKTLRDDIINRGYENVKRFSWEKCAEEIAKFLNTK